MLPQHLQSINKIIGPQEIAHEHELMDEPVHGRVSSRIRIVDRYAKITGSGRFLR